MSYTVNGNTLETDDHKRRAELLLEAIAQGLDG